MFICYNDAIKIYSIKHHAYKKEFRDIRGLLAQNDFQLIFPKH